MSTEIDLEKLSLMDTLDLAILVEDEARERYDELARQLQLHHTDESAGFFRRMACHELDHRCRLQGRRQSLFGSAPRAVERPMLWEVEAPAFESARAFMSLRAALEVALVAERRAWDYFNRALEVVEDPEVRALLAELREEEVEHQAMVRAELDRTPPEPPIDPDDFVDPPQAL